MTRYLFLRDITLGHCEVLVDYDACETNLFHLKNRGIEI